MNQTSKRHSLNSMMNTTMSPVYKQMTKKKELVSNFSKYALLTQTQSKFNMVQFKYGDISPISQVNERKDFAPNKNTVVNNLSAIINQDQIHQESKRSELRYQRRTSQKYLNVKSKVKSKRAFQLPSIKISHGGESQTFGSHGRSHKKIEDFLNDQTSKAERQEMK